MLEYLKELVNHRFRLFLAGLKLGVPIYRILKHDLSKLLPPELFSYPISYDWGQESQGLSFEFLKGINSHVKGNDHHWQYWVLTGELPRDWEAEGEDGDVVLSNRKRTYHFPISLGEREKRELEKLISDLNSQPRVIVLEMPREAALEMIADWASSAECDLKDWYKRNKNKILLHPWTREFVEEIIEEWK